MSLTRLNMGLRCLLPSHSHLTDRIMSRTFALPSLLTRSATPARAASSKPYGNNNNTDDSTSFSSQPQFTSNDRTYPTQTRVSATPGKRLMNRVLHVRRVARVNSGGKVRSVSALVVVGNGNGVAGYGEGRGADMQSAVLKATRNAEKNLNYFHRFNNRTVYQSGEFQWHGVKLKIMAAPPGYGIITSNPIHEICRMVGISDLGVKVYGSRNPMNVIKAMFEALKTQRLPEEIARMRGKRVEDVELRYYGMNSKK